MTESGKVWLVVLGGFVFACIFFANGGEPALFFVIMLVVIVISFIVAYKRSQKGLSTEQVATFDNESKCLTVSKRCGATISCVYIDAEKTAMVRHNPATITYTGATVGGVSVGNFDIQDESYSLGTAYKTGNYCLMYGRNYNTPIRTIKLTDELVEQAKRSPAISKYLTNNCLILTGSRSLSSYEKAATEAAMAQGKVHTAANTVLQAAPKSILSKGDCQLIRGWLAGK